MSDLSSILGSVLINTTLTELALSKVSLSYFKGLVGRNGVFIYKYIFLYLATPGSHAAVLVDI